jgi:C1A family cysteine protease
MNKLILVALLALTFCIDNSERKTFQEFQKFLIKYNKKYNTIAEYFLRYNVFKKNLKRFSQNKASYKMGINQFTDLTPTEFRKGYLNLDMKLVNKINYKKVSVNSKNDAPESWNWVDEGVFGPVKDQGYCGSCWAFSTMGNIEALNAMKTKEYVALSEQQLVDCDTEYDQGCNGGLMEYAFAYLVEKGCMTEKDYPYVGYDDTCHYDESKVFLRIDSWLMLDTQDENEIKEFLYTNGPLAIAINADPFQYYTGGIIDEDEWSCDPEGLNHGVVLVGYGNESGVDYWIIRNSWGDYWGEDGYVRVARGKGTCGVNTYVTTAVLKA